MSAHTGGSAAPERRLTPTERLHEVTMAAMNRRPAEPESSVSISRNARGVSQFEIVVRGPNPDDCRATAQRIFAMLEGDHPYPTTNGTE